ncbi:hypothetical protein HNQ94_001971 [Salirhabdus euzebyi]|uniref:DUF1850 domain-containing protein n=1 Tax=Salirhabdus euzebyi TaxID=394506 RepID=A0A841Q5B1_9BACI|nr:DUF1850 domain-containing protein [Salirhabdus euzebyi]MBB6453522.1 hypothetical protein [Salirhabdus euzebyi]
MTVDGKEYSLDFLQKNETFSIRWVHSVEKEEWEEFFYVNDDEIFIQSTRFKTFGAGVPNNVGEDSYIKDGWVYMVDINRSIGEVFVVRTGKETKHRFILGEKEVELDEQEAAFHIQPMRLPFIKAMIFTFKTYTNN